MNGCAGAGLRNLPLQPRGVLPLNTLLALTHPALSLLRLTGQDHLQAYQLQSTGVFTQDRVREIACWLDPFSSLWAEDVQTRRFDVCNGSMTSSGSQRAPFARSRTRSGCLHRERSARNTPPGRVPWGGGYVACPISGRTNHLSHGVYTIETAICIT